MEEECFTTPDQITFSILHRSFSFSLSVKISGQQLLFSCSMSSFLALCLSIHHLLHPSSSLPLSLPSAQSHRAGSLFLANLSLIHYWGLFFFLESQNKEGEQILWIFNVLHEKCIISHFSTIRTGKLLAGHNTRSHEMMRDRGSKGRDVVMWSLTWRGEKGHNRGQMTGKWVKCEVMGLLRVFTITVTKQRVRLTFMFAGKQTSDSSRSYLVNSWMISVPKVTVDNVSGLVTEVSVHRENLLELGAPSPPLVIKSATSSSLLSPEPQSVLRSSSNNSQVKVSVVKW